MSETTVQQPHFRVDARWLGDFIRNAYWYEHRHIYAKKVFDDLGLPEVYYQKILNAEVTLSNTKDGECYLTNKPEKKAQKELLKQQLWLTKEYIKLSNGRYVSNTSFEEYIENEWRRRRQADFIERYNNSSKLAPRFIQTLKNLRESYMKNMLESTGVTIKGEQEDLQETEKLILIMVEADYRINKLKPLPFNDYEYAIEADIQKQIQEVFDEMDEIYTREYSDKPQKIENVIIKGKLPPMRLKDGPFATPEQLERMHSSDWEIAEGEERNESAFISPKGVWWNVKFASHEAFSNWTIWKDYPEYDGYTDYKNNRAVDVLVQLGWILVNNQYGYGISIVGDMNIDQYIALDAVFGNRLLANGTIKALWRESPLNKE